MALEPQDIGLGRRIYKTLASIKTSVYLLGITLPFMLAGTIFPQGAEVERYVEAGGRYVLLVRVFDLLGVFTSPLFIIVSVVLFANLAVCTWERFRSLTAGTKPGSGGDQIEPTHAFQLTHDLTEARIEVHRTLREDLGFRDVRDDEWRVMERGLPWRWLTWVYHAAIVLAFFGFVLTFAFAYEDTVTLWPGEPVRLKGESRGRLPSLLAGDEPRESSFQLVLEEFTTDYVQAPELDYPEDAASRLAVGLGWMGPEYVLTPESVAAKDWFSKLRVVENGSTALHKTIEVNDPLRYGGYTVYQMAYDYAYRVRVNDNPILLDAEAGEDVLVPGLDEPVRFGYVEAGSLTTLDGTVEELAPTVEVERGVGEDEYGETEFEKAGEFAIREPFKINGARLAVVDYTAGSVLSFRYDPGFPLLWYSGLVLLAAMCLRFYGLWYRVRYRVLEADGITTLEMHITSKGLMADPDRLASRVGNLVKKDDLPITPLD